LQDKIRKSLILLLVSIFVLTFGSCSLRINADFREKATTNSTKLIGQEIKPICEIEYNLLDFDSQKDTVTFEIKITMKNIDYQGEKLNITIWDVAKQPVFQIVNITLFKSYGVYYGTGVLEARTLGSVPLYPFDVYYFALYFQVQKIEAKEMTATISEAKMHFSLAYHWEIKDSEIRGGDSAWNSLVYFGRNFTFQLFLVLPLLLMYLPTMATTYLGFQKETTLALKITILMSSTVFAAAQHLSMPSLYVASYYDELILDFMLINTFFLAYSILGYVFKERAKKALHLCFLASLLITVNSAYAAIMTYLHVSNLVGLFFVFSFVAPCIIILSSWIQWTRIFSKEIKTEES